MNGVLSAESAVLLHFETIGVVLLVLHGVVVSLLALIASQSHFNAHFGTSLKLPPCITALIKNLNGPLGRVQLKTGIEIPPEITGKAILTQIFFLVNTEILFF